MRRGCRTIANDIRHVCRHPSNLANGDVKSSDLKRLGIISHNGLARAARVPEDLKMGRLGEITYQPTLDLPSTQLEIIEGSHC